MGAPLMQIGEVAERTGLSLRTIRFYEETGLVEPADRSPGGFRLYSEAEVVRLQHVMRMKPLGFSVEEMAELLAARDELGSTALDADRRRTLLDTVATFAADARARVARLERAAETGRAFVDELERYQLAR